MFRFRANSIPSLAIPPRLAAFGIAFGTGLALCGSPSIAIAEDAPPESIASDASLPPGTKPHAQPPESFDPLTASDADLKRYGFPPRPGPQAEPQQYAIWKKLVASPQTRIAPLLEQTTIRNAPVQLREGVNIAPAGGDNATAVGSSNWSGIAVVDGSKPFASGTTVFGEYVVPVAQQAFGTCTGGWVYSAEWVGLDGFNSSDVLQAGIETDAFCSGSSKRVFYKPWFEWFPNAETRIKNLVLKPGNIVGVAVWNTSPTQGNALIVDYTTRKSVSIAFGAPRGTSLAGDSVEWIVERPQVNGVLAELMNYVGDPFNFCEAAVGNAVYAPGSSPTGTTYSIEMLDGSGANATVISFADVYASSALWFYEPGPAAQ